MNDKRMSISAGQHFDLSFTATFWRRGVSVPVKLLVMIMLLGDSCTGKTCLLIRFKDGTFLNNNFISTVGIDYRNKVVDIDGVKVKLQIWDTAGQERFRSVTHAYYRDADALLLIFDVTNRQSFENIRVWLSEIKEYAQPNVKIVLVGNKTDLPNRKIKSDEARKLAETYSISYLEASAKNGQNVEDSFMVIARQLCQSRVDAGIITDRVELDSVANTRRQCCGIS